MAGGRFLPRHAFRGGHVPMQARGVDHSAAMVQAGADPADRAQPPGFRGAGDRLFHEVQLARRIANPRDAALVVGGPAMRGGGIDQQRQQPIEFAQMIALQPYPRQLGQRRGRAGRPLFRNERAAGGQRGVGAPQLDYANGSVRSPAGPCAPRRARSRWMIAA